MSEQSDNVMVKVLVALVGAMAGIIATSLFLWITFPHNLATKEDVSGLTTQIQKQIDETAQLARSTRDRQERDEVTLGRLIEKVGLAQYQGMR